VTWRTWCVTLEITLDTVLLMYY